MATQVLLLMLLVCDMAVLPFHFHRGLPDAEFVCHAVWNFAAL